MENMNFMEEALYMPRKNQTVEGVVVSIKKDKLIIDLNTFTEGELSLSDFTYDKTISSFDGLVKVGETITCIVAEINKNGDDTSITLTKLPLLKKDLEETVNKMYEEGTLITIRLDKKVNKGYTARYKGVEIFVPEAQIDVKFDDSIDHTGETMEVKLIDKKHRSYVASKRILTIANLNENKEVEYNKLTVGEVVSGTVYKIEPFGALIKFEYNLGLLRTSQVAHERLNTAADVLKVGETVDVKIIKKEAGKIDLSRKALLESPHTIYAQNHKVSDVVSGKVIQKLPIGLILELEKNITALIHKNEFSWNPNDNAMASIKIGDTVEAAIISLDVANKKIGLSKKVLIDNPWAKVTAKVGDITDVKISEIVQGKGVMVDAFGVDGFISKNDLVFTEKQTKIEDAYQVDDMIKATVVQINTKFWELKLSAKKVAEDLQRAQFEEYMEQENEKEESIQLGDVFNLK